MTETELEVALLVLAGLVAFGSGSSDRVMWARSGLIVALVAATVIVWSLARYWS